MTVPGDEKIAFHRVLRKVVGLTPPTDKAVILGDSNGRVRRDFETWRVVGGHGVSKCNSNGHAITVLLRDGFADRKQNVSTE